MNIYETFLVVIIKLKIKLESKIKNHYENHLKSFLVHKFNYDKKISKRKFKVKVLLDLRENSI